MALYVKFECSTCENKNCTGHGLPTTEKVCDGYKHTTTNADRIRSMSDEKLAEKIGESIDCEVCKTMHHSESGECPCRPHQSCVDFWLDWLRQEAT